MCRADVDSSGAVSATRRSAVPTPNETARAFAKLPRRRRTRCAAAAYSAKPRIGIASVTIVSRFVLLEQPRVATWPDVQKATGERLPLGRLLTLAPLVLVAAGCGSKQNSLDPESPQSHAIATLWWIMLAGSTVGLAVIVGLLVASYVKRHEEGRDRPATITVLVLGIATPIL